MRSIFPPILVYRWSIVLAALVFLSAVVAWNHAAQAQAFAHDSPAPAPANPDVPKQVVAFCQSHVGKQVGDGECSSLAGEALDSAGAKGITGSSPGSDDYVWGDLVCVIEAQGKTNFDRETQARKVKPGDIIQFRDAEFASYSNGGSATSSHHTAVVVGVAGYGKQIMILQQNFGGSRFVAKATLNVDEMRNGWMRVYHPVSKD